MAEISFPFDAGPGADSYEDRWRRMARIWAPSGVVGVAGSGAYDLAVSGLTATIKRRTSGLQVAEAWVDGFMHRLTDADWSVAVPADTAANPRVDRIVLRLDAAANTVVLARVEGTPAASPTALPLTQVEGGVWEEPLWRFTVPANSGAPLTALIDDRKWLDPAGGSVPQGAVAYGSSGNAATNSTTTFQRVVGGLNVSPILAPGRIYEYELGSICNTLNTVACNVQVRALLGATAPAAGAGSLLAGCSLPPSVSSTAQTTTVTGKFTVGTAGVYTISPFISSSAATNNTGIFPALNAPTATVVVRDAGPVAAAVGATPIAVP